jgi:hypothetical protein
LVDTTADLPVAGDYTFTLTATDGVLSSVATVTVTATDPGGTIETIEVRIGASGDDVEERAGGGLSVTSSDLELIEENSLQTVGLRFTGISIPVGARIIAAWIQFTVDEPTGRTTILEIGAHDIGDAPVFSGSGDVTSRPLTVLATWQPPRWLSAGDAGDAQRTVDLSAVIQQVISRTDWAPGQAIALIIGGSGKRVAESFNGSPSQAPLLHIEYEMP